MSLSRKECLPIFLWRIMEGPLLYAPFSLHLCDPLLAWVFPQSREQIGMIEPKNVIKRHEGKRTVHALRRISFEISN